METKVFVLSVSLNTNSSLKMFTIDQKKFIVRAFGRNRSPTKVRREFLLHFKIKGRAKLTYTRRDFINVNEKFEKCGSVTPQRLRPKTKRTAASMEQVENVFAEDTSLSLRKAAPNVGVSMCTLWRILRWDIKAKFYRITPVQKLTDDHKQQRRHFCEWLLAQDEDFVQRVIWTDEKLFVLHQKPHRKNDGKWSRENPHEIIESNDRHDKKVMIFVAIVEGKIPLVHAFIDESGGRISVNGDCYLELLQDRVWPLFRPYATRRNLWWMQDGAPPHCTNVAKSFLKEKFRGRVISRGTEFVWPAHSPDLNPLDFHFWAAAQKQVYLQKPESIEELIECVKQFSSSYDQETIRRVAMNVVKRARMCLRADGGHFQHLL